ncbi:MAG TPA: hypothetical protein VFN26_08410 [Candidatus Acidoferrum sp.]|nr:hypothetical protein [Candidatus Acidoferrum sp.]
MTSLDTKIIKKGIETAKPIHPASWFRDTRLQIYYRRHVLERITGNPSIIR